MTENLLSSGLPIILLLFNCQTRDYTIDCYDRVKGEPKTVTYDSLPFTIDTKWVDKRMSEQMKDDPERFYYYQYYFETKDGYASDFIMFSNGKNQKNKSFEDLLADHSGV